MGYVCGSTEAVQALRRTITESLRAMVESSKVLATDYKKYSDLINDDSITVIDDTYRRVTVKLESLMEQLAEVNKGLRRYEEYLDRLNNGVMPIVSSHSGIAMSIAVSSPDNGANFTDHGVGHWVQAEDKSSEAAAALAEAVESGAIYGDGHTPDSSRVAFGSGVDAVVLSAAALSHDTGMSDNGYALVKNGDGTNTFVEQDPSDFDSVRNNHPLNSAVNVLKNRDAYRSQGFSDEDIDTMGVLCMAHSKSHSGAYDLNSMSDWNECFGRLDDVVEKYNNDHPDNSISFDSGHTLRSDSTRMSNLATSTLALRVGDVSRDSGPGAMTQSGQSVHVELKASHSPATSWETEINNYTVTRDDGYEITNDKSKRVHIGEQNIINNHTGINKSGRVQHTVTVNNGNFAPYCTGEALRDHLGEFASAKDGRFVVRVEFAEPYDDDTIKAYENWRNNVGKKDKNTGEFSYQNVRIDFPWDGVQGI